MSINAQHRPLIQAQDRRVVRTRRALKDAMIMLTKERGYANFNVKDICEHADVGRSSFYVHFKDKEDVLRASLDDLHNVIVSHWRASLKDGTGELGKASFLTPFLQHVNESRDMWRGMIGAEAAEVVNRRFRIIFADMFAQDLQFKSPYTPLQVARIHVWVGAFMEILAWWLDSEVPLSPLEVNNIFLAEYTAATTFIELS
ncbi:MAG: TetR/AcrR family transcriptional regulator [Armatimonadetes bacterium]|nr:TetR/AcrR family transcriptional regulator [Armatimonadota bacterium]